MPVVDDVMSSINVLEWLWGCMSNESFGLLIVVVIGLLFTVGVSSLILSCIYDKDYDIIKEIPRKHYYNNLNEQESASVIINDD